jgi:crotonobetainyl-CoA:carnitine CoA-transferase CaiB-like acyl-CoA transferase
MHDAALYWMMCRLCGSVVDGASGRSAICRPSAGTRSYNVYKTKDGLWLALGALERKFWVSFCAAIDRPDLAARHETTLEDQAGLIHEIRRVFAGTHAAGLAGPFRRSRRLLDADQHARRGPARPARPGLAAPFDHRAGLRAVRPPFLARETSALLGPAPELGADTEAILSDLLLRYNGLLDPVRKTAQ